MQHPLGFLKLVSGYVHITNLKRNIAAGALLMQATAGTSNQMVGNLAPALPEPEVK